MATAEIAAPARRSTARGWRRARAALRTPPVIRTRDLDALRSASRAG